MKRAEEIIRNNGHVFSWIGDGEDDKVCQLKDAIKAVNEARIDAIDQCIELSKSELDDDYEFVKIFQRELSRLKSKIK